MNNELLKYMQIVGRLTKIVSRGDGLDKTLKEGLAEIQTIAPSDYIIVWFSEGDLLRPYYWIGNEDFTAKSEKAGENMVGKVFQEQKAYQTPGHICVPLSNKYDKLGCIEFIKENHEDYSPEQADICEIFAGILALHMEDGAGVIPQDRTSPVLLSARGIKKSFKNGDSIIHVLNGVNMEVYQGELLVVLGESGCGKSTFLNIIGGMETADEGSFYFMGKEMTGATPGELTTYRRNNIGFIFQSYNLMPNLTARQNLQLIGELVESPMDADEALSLVGLTDKAGSYPSQLSGGQQQRVSIARAIVKRPKLIFADEPTAALDYATGIEVLKVMADVVKAGTTLVMVTHNEEITKMANRVVRMRGGKSYEVTINKHPLDPSELVW